ncbi:MAG: aspartyl protease family protein [Bacteroidetes bacterium]|nr:aspartyl protease family protein [Bacteroidota bacterium]
MRKFSILLFFISAANIFSQPKDETHLIKSYTYSATLPFELVQNLILINNININGRTGSFIFDTGNQAALVLNSSVFQQEVYESVNRQTFTDTAKGITGNIPVSTNIKIDSLTLTSDFTFASLDAVAFNLDKLKPVFGKNFLGFIGYGVLRELEFAIDYNKKAIHIFRIDATGNTLEQPAYKKKPFLNFTLDKGSIMANIYFAGKMLNFFLDTGAPQNSLDATLLPQLDKNYFSFTGLKDTVESANNTVILADNALMQQFSVQDFVFDYMDTNVFPFPGNATYNGILGYPFFKQKMFVFNYRTRQIFITE